MKAEVVSASKYASYGVREQVEVTHDLDAAVESIRTLGFAVVDGGYTQKEIDDAAEAFECARRTAHKEAGGEGALRKIDEHNTIRAALAYDRRLLKLALNSRIRAIVKDLIGGYYILSQQNGIINPPSAQAYNQAKWHRDLPYQHVIFSRPMAVNALFCLDAFTEENGATLVLPASHKQEKFPSERFIESFAHQVKAPAGAYIVLDCMCYHAGASNRTARARRAVNHVYTSPILRQQIDLPAFLGTDFTDDPEVLRLLGYEVTTPRSVAEYLAQRQVRRYGN